MGQTTPNMGIYIPAAGETNYDASYALGMMNIDQHNHSGGPNQGVPLGSGSLADGAVTYAKLNANVVDLTTGLAVNGALANQLQTAGFLKSVYQLSPATGFVVMEGSVAHVRTLTPVANQTTITHGDGTTANTVFGLDPNIQVTSIKLGSGSNISNFIDTTDFSAGLSVSGSTGFTSVTVTSKVGTYSRFGNRIFFEGSIKWNSLIATGQMLITGLPIAKSSGDHVPVVLQWLDIAGFSFNSGMLVGLVGVTAVIGNTTIAFYNDNPTSSLGVQAAGSVYFSGSYPV